MSLGKVPRCVLKSMLVGAPFGKKKKISCLFRNSKHVSWDVPHFSLVTIPTELLIITSLNTCVFFFGATAPPVGHGPLIHEVYRSHTTTHHIR
jgi:hypothetical protein